MENADKVWPEHPYMTHLLKIARELLDEFETARCNGSTTLVDDFGAAEGQRIREAILRLRSFVNRYDCGERTV